MFFDILNSRSVICVVCDEVVRTPPRLSIETIPVELFRRAIVVYPDGALQFIDNYEELESKKNEFLSEAAKKVMLNQEIKNRRSLRLLEIPNANISDALLMSHRLETLPEKGEDFVFKETIRRLKALNEEVLPSL